ncbi:MAG: Kae1-associated kinase Bud32, partial [Methanomicrobiales archaeon]|nr:Kae1-associated kinase Bud32 [Methanomicrobiales archaeon]
MLDHGISLPVDQSRIIPGYRADDVEVTWREPGEGIVPRGPGARDTGIARGAEAVVTLGEDRVEKRRLSKAYRVPPLDRRLIAERTRAEARLISAARRAGVPTPILQEITADTIVMERITGPLLKEAMTPEHLQEAGRMVGRLHRAGIIHGDLTTSNMIVSGDRIALIDFGLSAVSEEVEARGVDLHVLFQTLRSTTAEHALLRAAFLEGYREMLPGADEVLAREQEIEKRGRYL